MGFLENIVNGIVNMDEENIETIIKVAIDNGVSIEDIFEFGLNKGMLEVTKKYEDNEYYISEVIVCADTLNKGIKYLKKLGNEKKDNGIRIILAVVEGDFHEIGKDIVKIMLEAANFQVIDMGVNIPSNKIIERAKKESADIIALSTMMTTTMGKMKEVISLLEKERNNEIKVIIGGGCISAKYSMEIGANGYSKNAVEAVALVKKLIGIKER